MKSVVVLYTLLLSCTLASSLGEDDEIIPRYWSEVTGISSLKGLREFRNVDSLGSNITELEPARIYCLVIVPKLNEKLKNILRDTCVSVEIVQDLIEAGADIGLTLTYDSDPERKVFFYLLEAAGSRAPQMLSAAFYFEGPNEVENTIKQLAQSVLTPEQFCRLEAIEAEALAQALKE